MARPLRIEFEDAFYHIIQRGTERKNIFLEDLDKKKFLSYLEFANTAYNAIFHAYVLMDNHYHLILQTPRANLSKIMHYINTSYAAYFNSKRKRVGPLYQGRFKAIIIQHDEYLHYLSRYMHLNPVRANAVKDPMQYQWTSYKCYISSASSPKWLTTGLILSMLDTNTPKAKRLYKQFVLDGVGKEEEIIKENTIKGLVLGDNDFFEYIVSNFIDEKKTDVEIPLLKEIKRLKEPTLDHIKQTVYNDGSLDNRLKRRLSLYLSRKTTQKTLNEIAEFHGKITDAGVSRAARRVQQDRGEDKALNRMLAEIEERVFVKN